MSIEFDQDGLNTLTDEEREAIQQEATPEELEIMRSQKDDDEDDEDNDDGDDESSDADPAGNEGDSNDSAESADESDDTDAELPQPKQSVQFKAELPADYQSQVDALKDAKVSLKESYKNGDIDFDEYEEKRDELASQERALERAAIKAEISSDMNSQTVEQEWSNTVLSFNAEIAKAEGVDYAKDAARQKDLDLFVKALAGDPDNNDKPMRWFLDQAHKRVNALHGAKTDTKENKPDAKAKRKPPVDSLPKSLAGVPNADSGTEFTGEFADIDRLDGMDLELAIAKMSPAQREKYMAS